MSAGSFKAPRSGRAIAQGGCAHQPADLDISGQRRELDSYTLDGVDNTDVNFNTYIFLPSVNALEEFKVQTACLSAEFGRAAGQVNVVTKSGSNGFPRHRCSNSTATTSSTRARYTFTAAQAAAPKLDFSWHQFGYTAGGPSRRTGCSSCRTGKS